MSTWKEVEPSTESVDAVELFLFVTSSKSSSKTG